MKPARQDQRLIGTLAHRSHLVDGGIPDTLHRQADRHGPNWMFNLALKPKPETTCHCEKHVVPSTWQRIFDGAGETCGAPNCKPKGQP